MGERILVVDDNPANLKLLQVLLSVEGYEVATARDAEEALSVYDAFQPRLVLMDVQLPGVDGLEATRRLKLKDPPPTVLAVTAFAMVGDCEKALAAGCDGYITKPIDTRAFPEVIASALAARS